MMQPFGLSCKGGLNTNISQFEMLAQPGVATILRNFEVDPDGGYRRINGYAPFGGGSATRPEGTNKILGIYPYALGIVVCVDTSIYYSEDGITWLQINKDTGHGGLTEAALSGASALDRPAQGRAQFALMRNTDDHPTAQYGTLSIATGANAVAHFHIDGTGAGRTFTYTELSTPTNGTYIENHSRHLCVVDTVNAPSVLYYSARNDDRDFTGIGSGSVKINDTITGIKSFRDFLYIFCLNSIWRLENINNQAALTVVPVTRNVGCISGYSVQEIGGDLLFLAPDGIRTIAGTDRISDVELSSVSRQVQQVISELTSNISSFNVSSVVLRNKSQYRLFYTPPNATSISSAEGIIGTLTPNGFEWSKIQGIQAPAIVAGFDSNNEEAAYHGDNSGYIYLHDSGNSFYQEGVAQNIYAIYNTPNLDFGDVGTLKTLHYVKISISPEGTVQPTLRIRYNFESTDIPQPPDYVLASVPLPALFGEALFGSAVFGASLDPLVRQAVQGSGDTCGFRIFSDDTNAPYTINGLYFDYLPSGRR